MNDLHEDVDMKVSGLRLVGDQHCTLPTELPPNPGLLPLTENIVPLYARKMKT